MSYLKYSYLITYKQGAIVKIATWLVKLFSYKDKLKKLNSVMSKDRVLPNGLFKKFVSKNDTDIFLIDNFIFFFYFTSFICFCKLANIQINK